MYGVVKKEESHETAGPVMIGEEDLNDNPGVSVMKEEVLSEDDTDVGDTSASVENDDKCSETVETKEISFTKHEPCWSDWGVQDIGFTEKKLFGDRVEVQSDLPVTEEAAKCLDILKHEFVDPEFVCVDPNELKTLDKATDKCVDPLAGGNGVVKKEESHETAGPVMIGEEDLNNNPGVSVMKEEVLSEDDTDVGDTSASVENDDKCNETVETKEISFTKHKPCWSDRGVQDIGYTEKKLFGDRGEVQSDLPVIEEAAKCLDILKHEFVCVDPNELKTLDETTDKCVDPLADAIIAYDGESPPDKAAIHITPSPSPTTVEEPPPPPAATVRATQQPTKKSAASRPPPPTLTTSAAPPKPPSKLTAAGRAPPPPGKKTPAARRVPPPPPTKVAASKAPPPTRSTASRKNQPPPPPVPGKLAASWNAAAHHTSGADAATGFDPRPAPDRPPTPTPEQAPPVGAGFDPRSPSGGQLRQHHTMTPIDPGFDPRVTPSTTPPPTPIGFDPRPVLDAPPSPVRLTPPPAAEQGTPQPVREQLWPASAWPTAAEASTLPDCALSPGFDPQPVRPEQLLPCRPLDEHVSHIVSFCFPAYTDEQLTTVVRALDHVLYAQEPEPLPAIGAITIAARKGRHPLTPPEMMDVPCNVLRELALARALLPQEPPPAQPDTRREDPPPSPAPPKRRRCRRRHRRRRSERLSETCSTPPTTQLMSLYDPPRTRRHRRRRRGRRWNGRPPFDVAHHDAPDCDKPDSDHHHWTGESIIIAAKDRAAARPERTHARVRPTTVWNHAAAAANSAAPETAHRRPRRRQSRWGPPPARQRRHEPRDLGISATLCLVEYILSKCR